MNLAVKISVNGNVALQEVYENEKDKMHYMKVKACVRAEHENIFISPQITFDVPITLLQYESLRTQLADSKAERPFLRIGGDLEIKVDGVCIN